jgi:2-polyprenyl-3-methyl-5-hydroxy-6-metoxy-1,4-benzoquinol methylase
MKINHDKDTKTADYTLYLEQSRAIRWKKFFDVQKPYRNKLLSLELGRTPEVGCGIGRILKTLNDSVGVDHNRASIDIAKKQGLDCYVNNDFHKSRHAKVGHFDSLIFVHVLEHLVETEADLLLSEFRKYLKPRGKLLIICPQESGFRSDDTHRTFLDFYLVKEFGAKHQFNLVRQESFPFPRFAGKFFRGNEFICEFTSQI